VLIDQDRAMAGGITPGDAPGWPVTISATGSYRLVSSLNLGGAGANTTAIEIVASGTGKLTITLDLNGFLIAA